MRTRSKRSLHANAAVLNVLPRFFIRIKKKADDGHKVISFQIREDLLVALDKIADEINRTRNEIITTILEQGINNIEIE